jgi:hypothetical protein
MKRRAWAVTLIVGILVQAAACGAARIPEAAAQQPTPSAAADTGGIDWKAVDAAMGRAGTPMSGGVHRYGLPRSDLSVTVRGVRIRPSLSLGSWVAFRALGPGQAVAMGDLVLTEEEYNRVIARLQEGGVGQTAVHKHLPDESPRLWWTHIHATGDPVEIARTIRAALALTGTPAPAPPAPAEPLDLDTAGIHRALGRGGSVNGGVYQVSFPRAETIRSMGIEVPPSMGTATAVGFQPTGGGRAAINGDVVMTAGEVDGVLAALRAAGIEVVSLHNHMTDEEPRLFFTHFWAVDDAVKLARGLRTALDRTNLAGR